MGGVLRKQGWRRSSYIVSTKFFWGLHEGPNEKGTLNRKYLMQAIDGSLARLQLDYVDLVFCHRADPQTPLEETVYAMSDMISAGKVLYWGTSEWSAAEIAAAWHIAERHHLHKPVMEQPQYNLFHRERVENEYARLYADLGLGTTIWSPLASGLLTGKYNDGVPAGFARDRQGLRVAGRAPDRAREDRQGPPADAHRAGTGLHAGADVACVVPQESERVDGHHRRQPRLAGAREPGGTRAGCQARSGHDGAHRRDRRGVGHRRARTVRRAGTSRTKCPVRSIPGRCQPLALHDAMGPARRARRMNPLASWTGEQRSAYLYRACARAETAGARAELFQRLAGEAEAQAAIWRAQLTARGHPPPPPYVPDGRTRTRRAPGALARPTSDEIGARGDEGARHGGLWRCPPPRIRQHRGCGRGPGTPAPQRWRRQPAHHRDFASTTDSSRTPCLILGVAGATTDPRLAFVAGVAGLAAGAFAMAIGEYVSVRSQLELFDHQIGLERAESNSIPQAEAQELALIYAAKGLAHKEANRLAKRIVADPRARPRHTGARRARARSGGASVAAGRRDRHAARIRARRRGPAVARFCLHPARWALYLGLGATAVALLCVGATFSLFTGRSAWYAGLRMLALGSLAGTVTFGIGRLVRCRARLTAAVDAAPQPRPRWRQRSTRTSLRVPRSFSSRAATSRCGNVIRGSFPARSRASPARPIPEKRSPCGTPTARGSRMPRIRPSRRSAPGYGRSTRT